MHPRQAKPGELRWFIVGPEGQDIAVEGPGAYEYRYNDRREFTGVIACNPRPADPTVFEARSRTFIPAALSDNPDQNTAQYRGNLAGLPPELRAAYREGDFGAGLKDDAFPV